MDKRTKKKLEKKAITRLPPGAKLLTEKQGMALTFLVDYDFKPITDKECKTTCDKCRYCKRKKNDNEVNTCNHWSITPYFFSVRDNSTCKGFGSITDGI